MNKTAIRHLNTSRYVYPQARNVLNFSIQVARKDIKTCRLYYFSRNHPEDLKYKDMTWKYRDAYFDYFECTVHFSSVARYQKYYFRLEDYQENVEYLSAYGFTKTKPESGFYEYLYTNAGDIITAPDWSKGQIFYQIFPERFFDGNAKNNNENVVSWGSKPTRDNFMGGDIAGITKKLDYLEELSIQCLYLTPIFDADFNHKYATTNYFKIDPGFGTEAEFKTLVDECHKRGIKIILDGVFNHTGVHFKAFQDILKHQENSKYKDWYYINKFPIEIANDYYECVGDYKWMPKLNTSNIEVQEFILEVMEYWLEKFNIDGWRLDVADEVDQMLWKKANNRLKSNDNDVLLLGETWGYGYEMMHGDELDSVMNYVFRDAVRDFFAFESIDVKEFDHRINNMLAAYFSDKKYSLYNLLDSHDTARFLYLCDEQKDKLKLAVTFQFMFLGSPAIYYGDEIGITGDTDPDCRRAMVWEGGKQDEEILEWYKTLAKIRVAEPCVSRGEYSTNICDEEKSTYGFIRYTKKDAVYVVFNRANEALNISIPLLHTNDVKDLITDKIYSSQKLDSRKPYYNDDVITYKAQLDINIDANSVLILKQI